MLDRNQLFGFPATTYLRSPFPYSINCSCDLGVCPFTLICRPIAHSRQWQIIRSRLVQYLPKFARNIQIPTGKIIVHVRLQLPINGFAEALPVSKGGLVIKNGNFDFDFECSRLVARKVQISNLFLSEIDNFNTEMGIAESYFEKHRRE